MHLIYSALRNPDPATGDHQSKEETDIRLRFRAYTQACQKHKQYLADIQRHFPNWMPPFR